MSKIEIPIPFRLVKGLTLDTKVNDCLKRLPTDQGEVLQRLSFSVFASQLPKNFLNTPIRDLFYLDNPVHALTTRDYLESVNPSLTLSALFQERGDFIPFNPKPYRS